MELNQEVARQVALPSAAFYKQPACKPGQAAPEPASACWETSSLNPKNRIDSLDFPATPSWRIDGCIAFGTQFYAVPLFMGPTQPHRLDIFIPNHSNISPSLCQVLDLSTAFHTRDTRATQGLGITRHIVRCLQHWTSSSKEASQYKQFPFGSRIVFHNLPASPHDARISIVPTYHLERQMHSVQHLQDMWKDQHIQLPPTIDLGELHHKAQPHDSVSVVEHKGEALVFKAITSHTKYLYHELRHLLRMRPHPSIIERPRHLVTKKCGFGSKTAVVGFTLAYHPHGTIRNHIPYLALHNKIPHDQEASWALQIVRGLRHFRQTCDTYYSDLRLDNILLSDAHEAIMVDFEQRGVWSGFSAPEINSIECIRELAVAEDTPEPLRSGYADLMAQMLPHWEELVDGEEYAWPAGRKGYNVAWQCLHPEEQECCEVYMLGRVLWCLFEAQSAPHRAAVWTSYETEPTIEFPSYSRTPHELRRLIDWCTKGHAPTLGSVIVRSGNKLVLREREDMVESTPEDVLVKAKMFWTKHVSDSEKWVRNHIETRKTCPTNCAFPSRPTLAAVEASLERFKRSLHREMDAP
ncbi:hypothetical protein LMH87_005129 [Akanthomyces muscarius]|uniref:Protein kinase domain-containing protein n=1 Tax=Akanthomyces muscarius TaxID=2231603 RepID=A0A9W8QL80_AKAMU|nr:hypothetical protein LMH87_005129 [Akanthomyces muscarius]KAJ4163395.1 hypothetical protein LMH87_005129 [Akanthomyces muscarius]